MRSTGICLAAIAALTLPAVAGAAAPSGAREPVVTVNGVGIAGESPPQLERGVRRRVVVSYVASRRGRATVTVVISKGRWKLRLGGQPELVHRPGIWRWRIETRPPTTLPAGRYRMKATVVLRGERSGKPIGSDVRTRTVTVT